jgi:pimeloyl-ACP methyl ester carboxylesterase
MSQMLPRFLRGCHSILGILLLPLGRLCCSSLKDLSTAERLSRGLVVILPGIEGENSLSQSIALGLADGGVQSAIEFHDWTTGIGLLFLYHLRAWRRNVAQAERLVERIVEYHREYPGRPIHLIGYSGGAGLAVLTLERLPPETVITSTILLQGAISPGYDLSQALQHVDRGIWNFRSLLDVFFVGMGTCLAGTVDGRHSPAAGMLGFRPPADLSSNGRDLYDRKLHDVCFRMTMIGAFNLGGHFGPVNRVFVAEYVAPLLTESSAQPSAATKSTPPTLCR